MNVLLLRPINVTTQIIPPINLGYLATNVRKRNPGVGIGILDCLNPLIDYDEYEAKLRAANPDVLGLQLFTNDIASAQRHIEIARRVKKDMVIVAGGPHPSGEPETLFQYLDLDYAFKGEADVSFTRFLALRQQRPLTAEEERSIPGLIYRRGDGVVVNPVEFVENLDELGFPAWDLIPPNTYPCAVTGYFFKRAPVASLVATRGCPYQCTFCSANAINGRKIRKHSAKRVVEEIEMLMRDYGIREIHLLDDNFTFHKDYVMEFCAEIQRRKLDFTWRCANSTRLDSYDAELLDTMRESGAYLISAGIEFGTNRMLKHIKKNLTVEKIEEKVNLIVEHGFDVQGSFIIGMPGETYEEMQETVRFAKRLKIKKANFNPILPLPGAEVYEELKRAGKLKDVNWANFRFFSVHYVMEGMTRSQMKWFQRRAYLSFYLRPHIIWHLLTSIRSPRHFWIIVKAGFNYIFG